MNSSLCDLATKSGVDLIVIEGMGRAIHTNFEAEFTCDSLRVSCFLQFYAVTQNFLLI